MTTLIIDGDVIAYNACENRFKRNSFSKEDIVIDSNILADALEGYDNLLYYKDEADFTDEENEKYLNEIFARFKSIITDLTEICFADKVLIAVAGVGNYRKDIFPEYKANRHANPSKHNPFVPIIRRMATESGMAVEAHGMEADDLVRIWAEECRECGEHFVIASIDKDLKMISGLHYLVHHQKFFDATPEYALRFYYEQLLQGDMTDNIQGVPGIGPVKAKTLLADCNSEEEFQATVMQVYYSTVHQWRHALQLTGQLIYLKKHKDDWFDMSKWPVITLEDIVSKPKKSKKIMEPWTLETALAAIDPSNVTTRERWEGALMFLLDLADVLPPEVSAAVDVIAERDKVPNPEKIAYEVICNFVKDFAKTAVVAKKPVLATVAIPQLPVPQTLAAPLVTVTPPMVKSPVVTPPVTTQALPPATKATVTALPVKLPAFNPAWLNKGK